MIDQTIWNSFILCVLVIITESMGKGYTPTMREREINDLLDFPIGCPNGCSRILSPVCGFDGEFNFRYFNNECLLRAHRCLTRRDWYIIPMIYCRQKISNSELQRCAMACTNDYEPVCGQNGGGGTHWFRNECVFLMENCYTNGKWSRAHVNDCAY